MRILVITQSAWNVTSSTGNTISNLFSGLSEEDEVANIFCRDEAIDNAVCKQYFKVTENDILHNLLTPRKCGREIHLNDTKVKLVSNVLTKNSKVGADIYRRRYTSFLLLREMIWSLPVWRNRKLKQFLLDFSPDCIYMHGHYNLYMHKLLDYCARVTNAKIAMYWGDDMYGRKSKKPLSYFYETLLRKRFRKSIQNASLLFGGSIKLCEEYSKIFGKDFVPFFKECKQVRLDSDKRVGNPITIVYAGNLLYGREKVMVEFVKAITRVNGLKLSKQFKLLIFSNTKPSANSLPYLDDKENSCYMGKKTYPEVCKVMDESDLALFIESFDKNDTLSTRLSFSTKIIDCMQSAAAILAIGPKNIASIDYLLKNKIGYIITDANEMESRLAFLSEHPEIIREKNRVKVKFAIENHTNTSAKALCEIKKIIQPI